MLRLKKRYAKTNFIFNKLFKSFEGAENVRRSEKYTFEGAKNTPMTASFDDESNHSVEAQLSISYEYQIHNIDGLYIINSI